MAALSTARERRRVAVLVDSSTGWGRGIISGIGQYTRLQPGWQLFVDARGRNDPNRLPPGWRGSGIIARVAEEADAEYLHAQKLPVVNVSGLQLPGPQFPRVAADVEEAGRMAAHYFLERGHRHFGYLSLLGLECVGRQRSAFTATVRAAGCVCSEFSTEMGSFAPASGPNGRNGKFARWLRALPKPVAILIWSGGREVIDTCDLLGLAVPEEVALLSGSDDELFCEVSTIPISAVQQGVEQIGLQAAMLMDRLMRKQKAPRDSTWIAPLAVVTRQSTNALAISDRAVVSALGFIRDHASEAIQVSDVAAASGVSRRVLQRRFAETLHRSPAEYIRRSHLECAKRLLAQTSRPIVEIAEVSGFPSQQYLTQVMQRDTGMSPLKYRRYVQSTQNFHPS